MIRVACLCLVLALPLSGLVAGCASQNTEHADLNRVEQLAAEGWRMYQAGEYAAPFKGGYRTDPDPSTRVLDFWSDGRFAVVDADDDGHHEHYFVIDANGPRYVGRMQDDYAFTLAER